MANLGKSRLGGSPWPLRSAPRPHAASYSLGAPTEVSGWHAPLIAQTMASWTADLVERRRRVRVFIVCAAALYGGVNALLQIFGSGAGDLATTVNAAALGGIVAAIAWAMLRVDGSDLFAAEALPAKTAKGFSAVEQAADRKLVDTLMRLMADERNEKTLSGALCGVGSLPRGCILPFDCSKNFKRGRDRYGNLWLFFASEKWEGSNGQ